MPAVNHARLYGVSVLCVCVCMSIPAFADDSAQLAEIVVTAEKRAENLQSVPISVDVVSNDTLTKANVSAFADLAKFAPSMTMTAGDQPANSAIVIRGVGTFAFSVAAEPSVLVVVDDVAVGYQAQAFTDLVDIDRVEVLNGPQSTLFGKSASAGLVNVT
ncbi:MAG TPA: TonB-dependent receptor plug domain-containing protein, partial [Steroidobacteraceae bacterium]